MKPIWHDNDNGVNEADLQGYVDNLLDGRQRRAIEAYLATSPVEAERLAAYRRQNIALHALFDPLAREDLSELPLPMARLAAELEAQLRAPQRPPVCWRRRTRLAACAALLAILCATGWAALDRGGWAGDAGGALLPAALETPGPAVNGRAGAIPAGRNPRASDIAAPPGAATESPLPATLPKADATPKET